MQIEKGWSDITPIYPYFCHNHFRYLNNNYVTLSQSRYFTSKELQTSMFVLFLLRPL